MYYLVIDDRCLWRGTSWNDGIRFLYTLKSSLSDWELFREEQLHRYLWDLLHLRDGGNWTFQQLWDSLANL